MKVLQALELLFLCHAVVNEHKTKRKGHIRWSETKRDKAERDKTQIGKSIREIMLSPDSVTTCCVTTEYMIYSTTLLILLI